MPATPQDRLYGLTTSVAVKPPVYISADYDITRFGEQTIASKTPTDERTITTTEGMRVLLLGQDNPVENGIWVARRSFWVRATDFNGPRDAVNGTLVFSINGDCWQVEADDPVVIGKSTIHFRPTYPFEANLDIFQRTLRVPEASVNVLPSAEDRAWKGLGFDGAGQPKLQDPAGTGLWGYVPAIGSFEKGSLLTQRFEVLLWESTDEYWRWDGEMPKIVLPGSTPDTAGGRGKGKWLDVTDATLRSNLGSSEIPGAGIVMLGQKVTVQQAMDYLLNKGNAVRLSTYCLLYATENSAFAAALEGAKGADGYACRVIVNDTGRPVKLTERFLFQSVESTSVLGEKYNENLCGVVGEFELATGAGFDFISCYSPFINIVVTDGGGNSVDAATPLNSDFAVRMESGVIAPEFHITGYGYGGYLFGSAGEWNGETAPGVQCVHKSSLAAFGGAAALYVRGTTGFGNITSVWEEGVTHYSLIDTAYDVQIASYENFIPAAGAGQLMLRSCGSMHIGKLLTGAWGVPQVKIFDCPSVDIGTHLSVLGNSDVNTEDTYAADISGSVVHIGSSQLLKLGCGYRVGHGGSLFVDNINGNILNQAVSLTNNTSYDGLSTSTASSVTIKSARLFRGNSSLVLSSKDMFHVDATITSGKLELQSVEAIGFNYQRTSDYARLVNVLSQSANFKVYLDGVAVDYTGTTLPFYIYNYASLLKSIGLFFTGELQFSSGNSSGNGKVLEVSSGLNTGGGTTTYTGKKS
ncbi:hypothetical protein [Klebsiella michiganensis]|uniref:tail fiber/spike domain-containing protein n=3 Tax=Klebsiella michiganensis TaxID=1134687 RepID=UPI003B26C9AC